VADGTAFGRSALGRPNERRALVLFVVLLLALSVAPYAVAWHASPAGWTYSGSSEASLDDYPTYLAKMRAGARGEWTYRSPYAPEVGETIQVRPFYAALGALSSLFVERSWLGYHAARLLMGALCLWLVFRVASAVSRNGVETWAAFALATVGSGVGWWVGREGPRIAWSYDLWVPELNVFHSLLTNPHFPLSIVLILSTLIGVAGTLETGRLRHAFLGGAALSFLSLIHPYDDFVAVAALVLYCGVALAVGRHGLRQVAAAALAFSLTALPGVAWMTASYWTDASLASMGNAQPVGPVWRVLSGLGLLIPMCAIGLRTLAARGPLGGLLAAWVVAPVLLMLLPFEFPRRMVGGWHVPIGIASGLGLALSAAVLARKATPRAAGIATVAVVGLASLSTLDITLRQIQNFGDPGEKLFPIHLPPDLLETFAWLHENASARDVVLAPYGPSNWLPVYTDLCAYFGHWAEAPDRRAREAARDDFYMGRGDAASRVKFLRENRIEWILDGPLFRQRGYVPIDPGRIPGARVVHRAGGIEVLYVGTLRAGQENPPVAPLERRDPVIMLP